MTQLMELYVSSSDKLPQIDMSYDPGKGYDPINELMRAIILRAIEDYNSPGELKEGALEYFFADDDENDDDYIFSFSAICKHLGLNPEKTRYMIMNAKHKISTRRRAA